MSVYADDVNVIVKGQRDVQELEGSLALNQKSASAKVNWEKSEALLLGEWRDQAIPSLPGGIE